MTRFSVIMPSYLGGYLTGAKDREAKFKRAVNSVLSQTFDNFELIIISDGCEKTTEITKMILDDRIKLIEIEKQPLYWNKGKLMFPAGYVRNIGIENATGEIIVYLDTDDYIGKNHLKNIDKAFKHNDWVWFNDWKYNTEKRIWKESECAFSGRMRCGTSNIAHVRELPVHWMPSMIYGYDDKFFIDLLRANPNHAKIKGAEYYVCHIPKNTEQPFYDI